MASLIRLGRLTSVESSVINARLGNISPERLTRIKNLLINWLRKSN
ncbi:Putative Transcriptional modulator of MazE/toxin,MazF (fragment) [Microcystis aeruginosa PCC 9432]|uniref:Transcriptional modulator of MazE/toxin,MazF n=2 Tax=Microcystis aeruginosa TaxID=1126 RepID=A0A822LC30_MICAE